MFAPGASVVMILDRALALGRMRRVMIILDLLAAGAGELGEGAAALAAGHLGDEGLRTELAGRLHRPLHSMADRHRQPSRRL
jgi:hypothetical protein